MNSNTTQAQADAAASSSSAPAADATATSANANPGGGVDVDSIIERLLEGALFLMAACSHVIALTHPLLHMADSPGQPPGEAGQLTGIGDQIPVHQVQGDIHQPADSVGVGGPH